MMLSLNHDAESWTTEHEYNYFAEHIDLSGDSAGVPGTPTGVGTVSTDYEGHGRNLLLSTQTYFPDDPDRVQVTEFANARVGHTQQDVVLGRTTVRWLRSPSQGFWFPEFLETYSYQYDRGQLSRVSYVADDFCPAVPECDTCEFACANPETTRYAEFYSHDVFGRRIETMHCDTPHLNPPPDEFFSCKWQTTMYDYDGLSQNVLAIRQSPVLGDNVTTADRYLSTFTYGALGVISRTEEFGNADPSDNADHYYLADAMGGNAAMYLDHDGDAMTPRILQSQVHDAFGNLMSDSIEATAEYAWRGQEGSETDRAPNLVDMQARTYDPTIGRFLQADALPIASVTTQGMNRYIYCENDPVNASDPTGRFLPIVLGVLALVAIAALAVLLFAGWVLSAEQARCWLGGLSPGKLAALLAFTGALLALLFVLPIAGFALILVAATIAAFEGLAAYSAWIADDYNDLSGPYGPYSDASDIDDLMRPDLRDPDRSYVPTGPMCLWLDSRVA